MFLHRKLLASVSLDELTVEVERRGLRLILAESLAAIDRMTVADPNVLAEISAGLKSIPGLCRQITEKDSEVYRLREQLNSARVREFWLVEGHRDQKWGAMALPGKEHNHD